MVTVDPFTGEEITDDGLPLIPPPRLNAYTRPFALPMYIWPLAIAAELYTNDPVLYDQS